MPVANEIFPEAEEASDLYFHINNSQLTVFLKFGRDPLSENEYKMNQRLKRFLGNYEFADLFNDLTNKNAVLHFINLT